MKTSEFPTCLFSISYAGFSTCAKRLGASHLLAAEAFRIVIVHHAHSLHKGIADGRTHKTEASLAQIFAHAVRISGLGGHFAGSLRRLRRRKLPDVSGKAAELLLYREKSFCVADHGGDLQPVTHDAGICQQLIDFLLVVFCDDLRPKPVKGFAIVLALLQDRLPAQPRLRAFETKELKEPVIVMQRHAPLFIVIAHHDLALGPRTTL